jgi:hypothetical protein
MAPKPHAWLGPIVQFPTGGYDATRLANVGRNYAAASIRGGVCDYLTPRIDVGVKGYFGVNGENDDTRYRSAMN